MPALEKYNRSLDYTYAPGIFPTLEALSKRPDAVRKVLLSRHLTDGEGFEKIVRLCTQHGIRTEQADKALERISGKDNCFASAVVRKEGQTLSAGKSHLVLHRPDDKGNLGTIFRSALGFGFVNIAIILPSADAFDPQVVRASMGAMFSLCLREYADFADYRREFPHHTLYPFMLNGSIPLDEAVQRPSLPCSLVMGNEGSGLPASFLSDGFPVRIPHSAAIDSLNLGVAASLGMYAFSSVIQAD